MWRPRPLLPKVGQGTWESCRNMKLAEAKPMGSLNSGMQFVRHWAFNILVAQMTKKKV